MEEIISEIPVLGIVAGSRYCGGVLVVGGDPVEGWTTGPVDAHGHPCPEAADDVSDLAATGRLVRQALTYARETVALAVDEWGACRVAVEGVRIPRGSRLSLNTWLTPRTVVAAVLAEWGDAILVDPPVTGELQPRVTMPAELRWRRPADWGPSAARRHSRDQERRAYRVALAAAEAVAA